MQTCVMPQMAPALDDRRLFPPTTESHGSLQRRRLSEQPSEAPAASPIAPPLSIPLSIPRFTGDTPTTPQLQLLAQQPRLILNAVGWAARARRRRNIPPKGQAEIYTNPPYNREVPRKDSKDIRRIRVVACGANRCPWMRRKAAA